MTGKTKILKCDCGKETEVEVREDQMFKMNYYLCDDCEKEMIEKEAAKKQKEKQDKTRSFIYTSSPTKYREARMTDIPSQHYEQMRMPTVLIYGNFGTGKTHAGYALAHTLIEKGDIRGYIVSRAFKMMMDIKSGFSTNTYEKIFYKYIRTDLLVIDEYGKNAGSSFEESVLYEIINERYEKDKRTVIICNATNKDEVQKIIRPDVLDRFRNGAFELTGKSRR